jgi:N6-adenosine-specific RNA methylase IME4/ParB-like chromosome segregation protein Spo0J
MLEFHSLANLFPLIEGQEFEALVADVREHGVREPVVLFEGKILDGRNRYRAAQAAGVEFDIREFDGDDALGFVISLNLHRRHLSESQRGMVAAAIANMPAHRPADNSANLQTSQAQAAELLNVSTRTVAAAAKVVARAAPEIVQAVQQGRIAVSDAAKIVDRPQDEQRAIMEKARDTSRNLVAAARRVDIEKQREEIEAGVVELPAGVYEVISIDPPWPYGDEDGQRGGYDQKGHRASNPYPEMSLEEIAALDLPVAENCVLWLWTTHKFMRHSFALLDKWGFQDRAILTWVKDRMGLGRWLRSQSEFCIMATKGRPLIDLSNQTTVLHGPMREHSRKPDEFYAMVESLCPGRKIDWFSREKRPGWAQVGNEPEKFVA